MADLRILKRGGPARWFDVATRVKELLRGAAFEPATAGARTAGSGVPSFVRMRLYAFLAGTVFLAGCVGDRPPPPVTDTSMPVIIDYREHRVLNPPPPRASGRVDPVLKGPGREREFGPESRLLPPLSRPTLLAALERFRARAPHGGDALLGLARKRKPRSARPEPDGDGPLDVGDPDERDTDAPRRVAEHEDARQAALTDNGHLARLDPDAVKDTDGGYKLNFDDADIKDVLQAVLGNVLHLSYTVAPNVTGKITISSAAPQNRAELLSTMEGVLSLQGLSMTPTATGYRIAPIAVGSGTVDNNGKEAGYGISVVPLEFSSAPSIIKLVGGFLTEADGVRIDAARNTVIVRGPAPRREEIVRAIKKFDADWMHQQAVSVVELRRSNPDEVIGELNRIFDIEKDTGGATGSIQFKAIKRLRSIMVISRNPQLVKRAGVWIRRLDHQDTSAAPGIYIYRPKYREARELVRLVKGLFGVGSNGGGDSGAAGSVSFQNGGSGPDQGNGGGTQNRNIGQSSASFAGGLSSGGFGGGNGGGGGIGSGLSGTPFGGQQGGNVGGTGFGGGGFGSSAGGGLGGAGNGNNGSPGGLGGNLADPIEAGSGGNNGDKPKLSLTADPGNNSIVAYTDGETYAKVNAVLRQLDLPPLQVAINVTVAEVDLNDALKYGVQFYLNNMPGQVSLQATAQQGLSIASAVAATTATAGAYGGYGYGVGGLAGLGGLGGLGGFGGGGFGGSGAGTQDVILSALDSVSKVHILSNPSIVVMENKPATFEVGNQVPVTTQSAQSTIGTNSPTLNQVQYLDTGVILKIVPRVGQKGEVDMDLDQIISSVVPQADGTQSLTPTISKRRIASNISVRSGQSVMLAGLIQDQRQRARGQLPFVGQDIGSLLGNTDNQFSRTELVIFISPTVIRGGADAQAFAERHKDKLRAMDLHAPSVTK